MTQKTWRLTFSCLRKMPHNTPYPIKPTKMHWHAMIELNVPLLNFLSILFNMHFSRTMYPSLTIQLGLPPYFHVKQSI